MDFTTIKDIYDAIQTQWEGVAQIAESVSMRRSARSHLFAVEDALGKATEELQALLHEDYASDEGYRLWGITEGWIWQGLTDDEERVYASVHGEEELEAAKAEAQ